MAENIVSFLKGSFAGGLACALLASGAFPAFAADVKSFVESEQIVYTGATAEYVDGELVLTWEDAATPGTLVMDPTLKVEAEVLVVGGGGAGGTCTSLGAGGGGAGGLILLEDENKVALEATSYTIKVGAGGKAATDTATDSVGENGGDSIVTKGDVVVYKAFGGGGGGTAGSNGSDGGSGGGATRSGSGGMATKGEGAGLSDETPALGNAGGDGSKATTQRHGAGGGGSGGTGGNSGAQPGAGGSGLATAISGTACSYAGGGGGGRYGKTAGGAGGTGGGGTGGGYDTAATSAEDHTGSGGGGGGRGTKAGDGADGVVVIRLVAVYDTKVDCPEGKTLAWTGYEQSGVESSIAYEVTGGTTNATAYGEYSFTVKPAEGFVWSGDTGGTEERTVTWRITPIRVACPTVATGLVYTGKTQTGVTLGEHMRLADGFLTGTAATDYLCVVALENEAGKEGYVWDVADGSESSENYSVTWTIAQAQNEVTSLEIATYRKGSTPSTPQATSLFGSNWTFLYAASETATDWSETAPSEAGTWFLKATVEGNQNFTSAEKIISFTVWDDPESVFSDHVELTVKGLEAGVSLTDFPLVVRLSEEAIQDFEYARAGTDGRTLAFFMDDQMLDYDVEKWDTTGESILWVKVPTLTAGATLEMWWGLKAGQSMPGPNPEGVWADYAGVWHMGEEASAATAAATLAADSTGHGLDATPDAGDVGDVSRMVSADGVLGRSRVIESKYPGAWGNHLVVPNYDSLGLGGQFVFSTWAKFDNYSGLVAVASRKEAQTSGDGWSVEHPQNNRKNFIVRGDGSSQATVVAFPTTSPKDIPAYTHFVFAYDGTSLTVYTNGVASASATISGVTDNGRDLYLGGGFSADSTAYSVGGKFDETRLRKGTLSAAWVKAEYDSVASGSFLTNSLVYREGLKLNSWVVAPDISPRTVDLSEEMPTFTVTLGELREGTPRVRYVSAVDPDTPIESLESVTEPGVYYAIFEMTDSTGYQPIEERIEIRFVRHDPKTAIGGTNGDSGRVLLMNRDVRSECPIDRQGYSDRSPSDSTYWTLLNETAASVSSLNLQAGTESVLRKNGGARLWHLKDCRHGNNFPKSATANLEAGKNYLPWKSSTARRFDKRMQTVSDFTGAGCIVMQNKEGAAVYSRYFDEGVGTLYFDAVNGETSETGAAFSLRVEYATLTDKGVAATDENSGDAESESGDDWYTNLANAWKPVEKILLYKKDGTSAFEVETLSTNVFSLAVKTGGSVENFYRVVVPMKDLGPLRFRIVRESVKSMTPEDEALIILDNVVASYPSMSADLVPTGEYDDNDLDKQGALLLGQELATTVPFPGVGASGAYARAALVPTTNALDTAADPKTFVSSATMHYRWRYLSQEIGDWKTLTLDPARDFRSLEPLEIPDRQGDIEFWYEAALSAPYYAYVDYSGTGLGVPDYSEEVLFVTNRLNDAAIPPTGGTDWFFRLRRGASAWEGARLHLASTCDAMTGEYPMELVDDDMWRVLVPIPKDASGTCSVTFELQNRAEEGATALSGTSSLYGLLEATTNAIPANGTVVLDGSESFTFEIDHNANYYEFKFSSSFLTWSVARAEYQNFNHWHDAYAKADTFKTSYPTNGVNDVAMKTLTLDPSGWSVYTATNSAWNETFSLANSDDPGYPKDELYATHLTPNKWTANNLTFISSRLVSKANHGQASYRDGSGMAVKLSGAGKGSLTFSGPDHPKGIDEVTVSARLGQSYSPSTFTWEGNSLFKKNYTFFAPATMGENSPQDGAQDGEMSAGASVSVIGYYSPSHGCYEFRVERVYSDTPIQLALYKWTYDGQVTRLCSQDFGSSYLWTNDGQHNFFALFISLENLDDGSTRIICGRSDRTMQSSDGNDPNKTFSGKGHGGLVYIDSVNPLKSGAYGVASRDCPAQFVNLFHYDTPLFGGSGEVTTADKTSEGDGYYFNPSANALVYPTDAPTMDCENIKGSWILMPSRTEAYTYPTYPRWKGIRVPTDLTQTVELYLRGSDEKAFSKVGEATLSGYAYKDITFPVRRTGTWDLQLVTGSANVEVAVKSVTQTQWQAPDHESLDSLSGGYVYTQGIVEDDASYGRQLRLQPARAVASSPVSVRSPVLDGLGSVSFSYRNPQPGAEVWLQMATNSVSINLSGTDGYNKSIKSVDLGSDEPVGTWVTLARYSYSDLVGDASRRKSYYLGLHNQPDAPVKGVFRLFIPTNVVADAGILATNATKNLTYGQIVITGMTVSDEPGLDDSSWFGYNLRGIGDASDSERRMFLNDVTLVGETGHGLDLALNNSLNGISTNDVERAKATYPAIVSPTFKNSATNTRSGVGSVSFKARLYSTTGPVTANAGRIILYGASNSVTGQWDVLQTNEVTSSSFADFTWATKGKTYRAVKFQVETPAAKSTKYTPDVDRVILDEIFVGERIQPTITFDYVRPFRQNLMSSEAIEDILSSNEQPLAGESWGVQTKLSLTQLTDEIDPDSLEVSFRYYAGVSPWGYENWKDVGSAAIPLRRATGTDALVFRSVGENSESLVEPSDATTATVQYQVLVSYRDRDGTQYEPIKLESPADWTRPDWYHPVDLNAKYGYSETSPDLFSAYTILDSISPGRAWINEVNFNDGAKDTDNQFIEVCMPSGVDMTGWFLRLTDLNKTQWVMAKFGAGELLPASSTRNESNGFAFLLAGSPATELAGGPQDADGERVALDGTWSRDGITTTAEDGTLLFSRPFQFELVRPSGIVEHQFVLGGTNVLAHLSFGGRYDATNLWAQLQADDNSPIRFTAGDERGRLDDGVSLASAGVITGATDVATLNPGRAATWSSKLVLTPGALNKTQDGVVQTIPDDWFVMPNGTNAWVTVRLLGSHLVQEIGGLTNTVFKFVLPQGATTNVTYRAEPWYELASLAVDGEVKASHTARNNASFIYTIAPTGRTCLVEATEGFDAGLGDHLDLSGAYAPSVVTWLSENWPDRTADEIKKAVAVEPSGASATLGLLEMYWLDIPPFAANEAEAAADPIWFFHYGITNPLGAEVIRTRTYGTTEVAFTNVQIKAQLFLSNAVSHVAYAPQRLQGLDSAKSDTFAGRWTSESMQILGRLDNGKPLNEGFLPFRSFIFDANSFTPATDAEPFTSTIELIDPFSTESAGYSYGYHTYPRTTPVYFKLGILETNAVPATIERLKADSTYKNF